MTIADSIADLFAIMPNTLADPDKASEIYVRELLAYPAEDVRDVCDSLRRTERFLPPLCDILSLVQARQEVRRQRAQVIEMRKLRQQHEARRANGAA